jgi:hypothetical protein
MILLHATPEKAAAPGRDASFPDPCQGCSVTTGTGIVLAAEEHQRTEHMEEKK